jgi:anti-sigma regulatory factor (Ser/Thr protein kinase)
MEERLKSYELRADSDAPAQARALLSPLRLDGVMREQLEDACLLVSETVTNAVRHSGLSANHTLTLAVEIDQRCLRVEIEDRDQGFNPDHCLEPKQEGGFGLEIVEALASSWGTTDTGGFSVWFELANSGYQKSAAEHLPENGPSTGHCSS